jgi:hypothetical protein
MDSAVVEQKKGMKITLMNGEIAAIAEHDSVTILAFRIVANSTSRVFRGERQIRFGDMFSL